MLLDLLIPTFSEGHHAFAAKFKPSTITAENKTGAPYRNFRRSEIQVGFNGIFTRR
jgi:hypothetical protein